VSTALLSHGDGAVGVIENLSELKALEAEHRRLDRLAALGEMSAVVAHELRNPIAGVAAGVEYLTRNAPKGSAEQQGAAMIQSEIERVNRILEDILFVARPLKLEKELTPLPPIINRVVARVSPQATASSIAVKTHFADDLPALLLDSQRIEQVFSNFIGNAIQSMSNGGTLTLSIDQNSSNQVQTTITDTGTGISPQLLNRIFDPFFTTKTRGTGLGLSIARRIVEAHNGLIKVDSQPGHGTSFYILLPAETR
jgi:signal transduction histidine kinase